MTHRCMGALLALTGGCASAAEERRWTTVQVEDIEVISALDDARTKQKVEHILRFERAMETVATIRHRPSRRPTVIYLFPSWNALDPYRFDSGVAGFYVGAPDANIIALDASDDLDRDRVLYHEYTHLLLMDARDSIYPAWYNEGFSEFMSTIEFADDEVRLGRVHAERLTTLDAHDWVTLDRVVGWDGQILDDLTTAMLYGESWALVHYLHMDATEDRHAQISAYLGAFDSGSSSVDAFAATFGSRPDAIERKVQRHVARVHSPVISIPTRDLMMDVAIPDPYVLPPARARERLAELAIEVGPDVRPLALRLAREAVSLDPSSARAHIVLARALPPEDSAQAGAHLEKAADLGPHDARVLLYRAAYLLQGRDPSDADRRTASALLAQLGATRSDNAYVQWLIAIEAKIAGDEDRAIAALERAWELDRRYAPIAVELAHLHAKNGNVSRACELTRAVEQRPHLPPTTRASLALAQSRCKWGTG